MAIKPCPFCAESEDLELGSGTQDREGYPVYIYCATCGSQGPWVYATDCADIGRAAAVREWNLRGSVVHDT